VLKNRHGETRTIELTWNPEYTTFSALDTYHGEDEY
jgi:replicative DNA helicase